MRIANYKTILKDNNANELWSNIIGWSTFNIMAISVIIMFVTRGKQNIFVTTLDESL